MDFVWSTLRWWRRGRGNETRKPLPACRWAQQSTSWRPTALLSKLAMLTSKLDTPRLSKNLLRKQTGIATISSMSLELSRPAAVQRRSIPRGGTIRGIPCGGTMG